MQDLEMILKDNKINYQIIKEYIDMKDVEVWNKILENLHKFDEDSKMMICYQIIKNTCNSNIINNVCMNIITFIKFDYEYYKKILLIIAELNESDGDWIEEIKENMLLRDGNTTLQDCFKDFSRQIPFNIKYDISIIIKFLEKYREELLSQLDLNREEILIVCNRLNYVMTINVMNILNLYFYFDKKVFFTEEELKSFLYTFIFNYPSICDKWIEDYQISNSSMFHIMTIEMQRIKKENDLKHNMSIFYPIEERILKYRKRQLKQNVEINKMSREKSLFLSMCKSNTILYGKKYGMAIQYKDKREISVSKMQEFLYEYPYPYEYIIDPIEYIHKVNDLKELKKER